jgi:hypothetical protein
MLVGMGMGMGVGRRAASEPYGRGKNGGRSHSFGSPPFQSLSIKNMYGVCSNGREICFVNECPRKEWRGGREK